MIFPEPSDSDGLESLLRSMGAHDEGDYNDLVPPVQVVGVNTTLGEPVEGGSGFNKEEKTYRDGLWFRRLSEVMAPCLNKLLDALTSVRCASDVCRKE